MTIKLRGRLTGHTGHNGRRTDPQVAQAEAYRILRSNFSVAIGDMAHPTVLVTSAYANEGKTSVTANLAVALAAAGKRVGLVDLDLRHPDLHRRFGAENQFGVSDVLLERRPLDDCLQYLEVTSGVTQSAWTLYLLTTGTAVEQTTELLGSGRTSSLLEALANQVDVVLIDTPPVLPVADTLVIGRIASGAMLVVEAGQTPVPAVQRAKDALIRNQTRLLGVIMNGRSPDHSLGDDYSYGYGYGYGNASNGNRDQLG